MTKRQLEAYGDMGGWGAVVEKATIIDKAINRLDANRREIASLKSELWHALKTIQDSSSMRTLEEKEGISHTEILGQRIAEIERYKTQEDPRWYVNKQS
jgi:hypothetical protein